MIEALLFVVLFFAILFVLAFLFVGATLLVVKIAYYVFNKYESRGF